MASRIEFVVSKTSYSYVNSWKWPISHFAMCEQIDFICFYLFVHHPVWVSLFDRINRYNFSPSLNRIKSSSNLMKLLTTFVHSDSINGKIKPITEYYISLSILPETYAQSIPFIYSAHCPNDIAFNVVYEFLFAQYSSYARFSWPEAGVYCTVYTRHVEANGIFPIRFRAFTLSFQAIRNTMPATTPQ